jgi:hemoglobin
MGRPSIYEHVGGDQAFQGLAARHHELCLADPELNHPFSHTDNHAEHVERLGAYWAEVFGGPAGFPGGHSAMLAVHSCQEIPEGWDGLFLACFLQAADQAGFPEDVKPVLKAYMEAALTEVNRYSPKGSVVPENLPTPMWGWDGLSHQAEPHQTDPLRA